MILRRLIPLILFGVVLFALFAVMRRQDEFAASPVRLLILKTPTAVRTLDPAYAEDLISRQEILRGFQTLFRHASEGQRGVQPALASGPVEFSADFRKAVIRVRPGSVFADSAVFVEMGGRGREVVARDIGATLMRLSDGRRANRASRVFAGRIKEATAVWNSLGEGGVPRWPNGIQFNDRYTLTLEFEEPWSDFETVLADPVTAILPEEQALVRREDLRFEGVGSGLYRLVGSPSESKGLQWLPREDVERSPEHRLWSRKDSAAGQEAAVVPPGADLQGMRVRRHGPVVEQVAWVWNSADSFVQEHEELRRRVAEVMNRGLRLKLEWGASTLLTRPSPSTRETPGKGGMESTDLPPPIEGVGKEGSWGYQNRDRIERLLESVGVTVSWKWVADSEWSAQWDDSRGRDRVQFWLLSAQAPVDSSGEWRRAWQQQLPEWGSDRSWDNALEHHYWVPLHENRWELISSRDFDAASLGLLAPLFYRP